MIKIKTNQLKEDKNIPQYNHIIKEFSDIVNDAFKKLDILNYYPYGPRTDWSYWLCGDVDLKKEYKKDRNKNVTSETLIFKIFEEVGRSMNYLMTHGNDHWFDRQRINAFAIWKLINSGWVEWTKEPLNGLSKTEKEKLYDIHEKRANLLYGHPAFGYSHNLPSDALKKEKEEWAKNDLKSKMENRKKYGIYYVKHLPIIELTNSGKNKIIPLYTKQELAAIWLMVSCSFENLC